ncbi:MAG: dialkylresorcinol condensing enzyme DarA [Bacteroidetes bacterium]|nr:dialkylresorcinol condensing enzyme DarA [Bacteroidota bacterium]
MKHILVIFFTQSGQLKEIADRVLSAFPEDEVKADFFPIREANPYPFPWSQESFFDAFPESVQGIPCEIRPLRIDPTKKYDLVILAYQVWFLSPSIPFWSFLMSDKAREIIHDKPVITLLGVRNMWIMAHEKVKSRIQELGGKHVGNIVLQDRHQNLVSVITIVHWIYTARKERFGIFPPAGVSEKDIRESDRFGEIILPYLRQGEYKGMQRELVSKGAVRIIPDLMSIEKKAIHIFGAWARFVLKKGKAGDPARKFRLSLFRIYLFTVIYLVSPIASLIFYLTWIFAFRKIKRNIRYYKLMTKKEE